MKLWTVDEPSDYQSIKEKADERLSAHDYLILEEVKSTIDPDATFTRELGFKCPRCKTFVGEIDHGETKKCRQCGLTMTVFGNSMYCKK